MDNAILKPNRREMLRTLAAGAIVTTVGQSLPRARAAETASLRPASPQEFRAQMHGAILSIPTPFLKDQQIDYAGITRMIDRSIPHKIRIFSLTSGNSQYDSLTLDEIYQLTSKTIEAVNGRGLAITSTDDWDLPETVKYSKFSEAEGADAVQVMRPAGEDDNVVTFFEQVADSTRLPLILHGDFSVPLLERLLKIDSIVALKQDVSLEYYIDVQRKLGDRLAIFEGGPEYAFLVAYPYGSRASYTTLGTFAPQITRQFWDAIEKEDLQAAYKIVHTYEHPFFDHWSHGYWRASLEHFGVAARYLRPPRESFTDAQMREVATFYRNLGLS
jgi:dihydrodipicolinate synthase/N-acetylneuraminate lyase